MTPAELITGIVTDEGVLRAPYDEAIAGAVEANHARWAAEPRIGDLMRAARGEGEVAPSPGAATAGSPEARPTIGERLDQAG